MRAGGSRQSTRFTQRRWSTACVAQLDHDGAGNLGVSPPSGVHDDGSSTHARPYTVSDQLVAQPELGFRPTLWPRFPAISEQWPIGDADTRNADAGPEMDGKTRSTRVVATGRIDEKDVWNLPQLGNSLSQKTTFAHGEQAWAVGRIKVAPHHTGVEEFAGFNQSCRGPRVITGRPGPLIATYRGHKHTAG